MAKTKKVANRGKGLKGKKNCCDDRLWDHMNRNVVPWSIGLLLAAVIIVDLPVLSESFKVSKGQSGGGGGINNVGNLAEYRRTTPDMYQGPQTSSDSEFTAMDDFSARTMYYTIACVLFVAFLVFMFATK